MKAPLRTSLIAAAFAAPLVLSAVAVLAEDEPFDIEQAIAAADSKAEHERIAQFFEQEATQTQQELDRHRRMLKAYEVGVGKHPRGSMRYHCGRLISSYEAVLAEQLEMARGHRDMAMELAQ